MKRFIRSRMTRGFGALAAALLVSAPSLAAQTGSITGRVVDSGTNSPIASAQVFIADLDLGVLTQQNGSFNLQNVPAGSQTVTVQRLGYRDATQTVTVTGGSAVVVNFTMEQSALQLEAVIVTGTPGGTQRRALGNSVERLDAAAVTERGAISNMQDLLAARTPGLRFNMLSGEVGGGSGITIRGVNSVQLGSQPLIYVDGVRVNNDATVGPATGSGGGSAYNDLNPEEIESIEVIKGASAAALYGTEASSGVIQIITKKGNVGAPEFTFETTQGANFVNDPAARLGDQYTCKVFQSQCAPENIVRVNMYDEANDYLHQTGRFADCALCPFPATSDNFLSTGYSQRYNLSVRGGTDQVRYYLSGAWDDETGVVTYNTDTSTNLRANVTVLLADNLNLDISTGYAQGSTRYGAVTGEGMVWQQLVWSRPSQLPGIRSANGSGNLGFQERWPQDYANTNLTRDYSRFTGSMTASYNFQDWLSTRLTVGIDKAWDANSAYYPASASYRAAPDGRITYSRPIVQNLTFDYSASGRYQLLEDLGTTTSFGARYYSRLSQGFSDDALGFATPVQTTPNQADNTSNVGYTYVENKTAGFYVQEELNWRDRVYLTGALSGDDNSAFGSGFDLQYYPNAQASWVISEEPWWNIDFINSLRLRGSWGKSGRQPSTTAALNLYGAYDGPNGKGLVPTRSGNADIGPEVTEELDLGLEVALLDDRVSATFSRYQSTVSDLLVSRGLAPSTGLPGSRQSNLGEMKGRGWEASVDARLFESDNVAFDLNIAGDYTTNKISALGEGVLPGGNFQLGWPYPNISADHILVSASLNDAGTSLDNSSVRCDPGVDVNGGTDGPRIVSSRGSLEAIPCADYHDAGILLGAATPNYTVRVAPTLTLHEDLQLYALAEGQYGRWNASIDAQYACSAYANCLAAVERTDPFFLAGAFTGASARDDRYIGRYLTDFWRMREIGARYTLPRSLVDRLGADRATLSVSARNLFLIWQRNKTDLSGNSIYDPEYANNGNTASLTSLWGVPGLASFDATLRVTF